MKSGRLWAGFSWLRIETSVGLLQTRESTFGFHKMLGMSQVTEQLLASQEGPTSTELVGHSLYWQ
jgi:hypothetical protein